MCRTPVRPWRTPPAGPLLIPRGAFALFSGSLFFAADVPCALRAWSPFCFFLPRTFPAPCGLGVRSAFFCRGRSLRPAGLESACGGRSRGNKVIYASLQFVASLLTPPAGPPLIPRGAFALFSGSLRGPQSRPLYQRSNEL